MRIEQLHLLIDSVNYLSNSQEKLGLEFKISHSYDYPGEGYVYRSLILLSVSDNVNVFLTIRKPRG